MGAAQSALGTSAQCLLLVALGYQLKQAAVFTAADAQACLKLAGYFTIPAVVLQACTAFPTIGAPALLSGGGIVLLAAAALGVASWLLHQRRQPRERALLVGSAVGWEAAFFALPFVEALCGLPGVLATVSSLLGACVAVHGVSYLLFATAGPAFPEQYKHADGGIYTGEWRGLKKDGFGVYQYSSGASYQGEWRDNLKDGRGVYYFPKGGTYEGEWSQGYMSGIGVRTYGSGKVTAGRWRDNQLEVSLELWQCAAAAEGAADAAMAARRVLVGGGKPLDAAQQVALQPLLWACGLGLLLHWFQVELPPAAAALVAVLAPANAPLLLVALGMLLELPAVQPRQVPDVAVVLGSRLAAACFLCANAAVALTAVSGPSCSSVVLPALLVLCAPIPAAAVQTCRTFRLNESLAASLQTVSVWLSLVLVLVLPTAAAGLGFTASGTGDPGIFPVGLLLAAALAAVAAGAVSQRWRTDVKVKMTYRGTQSGTAAGSSKGAGSATAAAAGADATFSGSSPSVGLGPSSVSSQQQQQPPDSKTGPDTSAASEPQQRGMSDGPGSSFGGLDSPPSRGDVGDSSKPQACPCGKTGAGLAVLSCASSHPDICMKQRWLQRWTAPTRQQRPRQCALLDSRPAANWARLQPLSAYRRGLSSSTRTALHVHVPALRQAGLCRYGSGA